MYQVINNLPIDYDFQSKTKEELKLYAKWFEENKESRLQELIKAVKTTKGYENWENAPNIGYWRVEDNKIKVEYFLCGDSGFYKREQGEIKGDTLVFYQTLFSPIKGKVVRETLYVLSDMSFE